MPPHPHLGWINPVMREMADPGTYYDPVSKHWYTFATNGKGRNIQCWYSTDLCSWTEHPHDVLPGPFPHWTGTPGLQWAPEVISAPGNRPGHLLYYAGQDKNTGKQCIIAAYTEGGPLGPYRVIVDRPLVSRGDTGGCIDPQPFVDPQSGKRWLVFKNDQDKMYTSGTQIWIQELSEDGLSLVGHRHPLQAPSAKYQNKLLEAPYLIYHQPSGTYCLFYSSGTFTTKGYATSYSISRNGLLGPYQPSGQPLLYTDSVRGIQGPGGACVITGPEGHTFIVFHSLEVEDGPRHTCIHRLCFGQDGTPYLPGRPCQGKRIRLLGEEEDDHAHGFAGQDGGRQPHSMTEATGDGGHGGDKFKHGLQKVFHALK